MTLSTLRPTVLLFALVLLLVVACGQPDSIEVPFEPVISAEYDPVTIANEATLKGAGNVAAQPYDHVTIANEAELKGAGNVAAQTYDSVTIANEAQLKGNGIAAASKDASTVSRKMATQTQSDYDAVTIANEAELKGEGITQPYVMSDELIADLKAAPFSIINEALLKGDGIYANQ